MDVLIAPEEMKSSRNKRLLCKYVENKIMGVKDIANNPRDHSKYIAIIATKIIVDEVCT